MNHKAYAKAIDDVRESWIGEHEGVARDALHEQAVLVAEAVRDRGTQAVTQAVRDTESVVMELYSHVYESVFPNLAEIVHDAYAEKSIRAIPDLIAGWLEAARRLIFSRPVQRRVKLVTEETINEINKRVLIGLEQGLSVDRIADLIDGTEYGRPVEGASRWSSPTAARLSTIRPFDNAHSGSQGRKSCRLQTRAVDRASWIPALTRGTTGSTFGTSGRGTRTIR